MKTKVQSWGNSMGLRIPKAFARELQIENGAAVEIAVRDGELVMKPAKPARKKKYRLEDLVARVTKKNRHPEIDWGGPVGREVW